MKTSEMVGVALAIAIMSQGASALAANPESEAPRVPPADQPLVRVIVRPTLAFEAGGGVLGYVAGAAGLGPVWNARMTADLSPRFAVEGSYTGSVNQRSDNTGALVYTAVDASMRYNILRADVAPVQPFVAAGVGYAAYGGPHGDLAAMVFPLAAGAERLMTPHIKLGARLSFRPALFDNLGYPGEKNPPGGDTWCVTAHLGGEF